MKRIMPDRTVVSLLYSSRRNEMLGMGVLGTIIVIVLVVWLIRRV